MVDVVGLNLQRDRIAGLAGQFQRLVDTPGQPAGRDRNAVPPEQLLAGRLRDPAGACSGE